VEWTSDPDEQSLAHLRRAVVGQWPQLSGEEVPLHGGDGAGEVLVARAIGLPFPELKFSEIWPVEHHGLDSPDVDDGTSASN
jgi:hypothetical protein